MTLGLETPSTSYIPWDVTGIFTYMCIMNGQLFSKESKPEELDTSFRRFAVFTGVLFFWGDKKEKKEKESKSKKEKKSKEKEKEQHNCPMI